MTSKVHMTRRGYEALQDELRRLKFEERPRVVDAIRVARDHGDLSENAEYDAAKERQAHVETRILQIEDRLARAEVVDTSGLDADRVRFGTTVVLEDRDSGAEVTYTLVGEDEADVEKRLLSVTSPVGRALIGKEPDDEVVVVVPSGTRTYEIREIKPMD
jgi:transcription elongation factor GreA